MKRVLATFAASIPLLISVPAVAQPAPAAPPSAPPAQPNAPPAQPGAPAVQPSAPPAPSAAAAPSSSAFDRGFGRRSSFVFSLEQIFGYEHEEFGGSSSQTSTSIDSEAMSPLYENNVGLFWMNRSGLNLGAVLGLAHIFQKGADVTLFQIRPRIGYAGAVNKYFGYWLRAGPSLLTEFLSGNGTYIFSFGGEAYGVITPVPHFGILLGPNVDIYMYGRDNRGQPAKLTRYGLTCGLFGEFW